MRARHVASTAVLAVLFAACTSFEDLPYTGQGTSTSGGNGSSGNNPGDGSVGGDGGTQPDAAPPPPGCEEGETPRTNPLCISELAGVFVSSSSSSELPEDGSKAAPYRSIHAAIAALKSAGDGRRNLFIAAGDYAERVEYDGWVVNLFGGITSDLSAWDPAGVTRILAPADYALRITNVRESCVFEDLVIEAGPLSEANASSLAVIMEGVGVEDSPFSFRHTRIVPGNGRSAAPVPPATTQSCPNRDGSAASYFAVWFKGDGGRCSCEDGVVLHGGDGGGPAEGPQSGRPASPPGGAPGGACDSPLGASGQNGAAGDPQKPGAAPNATREGSVKLDSTQPASWEIANGSPGQRGAHGAGGGGGARNGNNATGGGGGAGGCGGAPGSRGNGGGGSFGILAVDSHISFTEVSVAAARGGDGAAGGAGGAGGPGGAGGGGSNNSPCASPGGTGGAGGPGGDGGGGAGGPVIGVLIRGTLAAEPLHEAGAAGGLWGGEQRRGRVKAVQYFGGDGNFVD